MATIKYNQKMIWSIFILLCVAGCRAPTAEATIIPSTPTPTSAPTPTPTPSPQHNAELIEVRFDGSQCTLSDLTELPPGTHSFILFDSSGTNQELWISNYIFGKSWQDVLDLQSEPGEYFPKPGWAVHPPLILKSGDDSSGGKIYTFKFSTEGRYGIAVGRDNPASLWLCGPFLVVKELSQ
jgi:hypothetical protein